MKKQKIRRRLVVDPGYQARHAMTVLSINGAVILLTSFLLSWFYLLFFNNRLISSHNQFFPFYIAGTVLLLLLFSLIWSLRRSRIIAGMIEKIEDVLYQASKGVFPEKPITFRNSDPFKDLANPINQCLVCIQDSKCTLEKQKQNLQKLEQDLASDKIDVETARQEILQIIDQLQNSGMKKNAEKQDLNR